MGNCQLNHLMRIIKTVCTFTRLPCVDGMFGTVILKWDTYVKEVRKLNKNALLWLNNFKRMIAVVVWCGVVVRTPCRYL